MSDDATRAALLSLDFSDKFASVASDFVPREWLSARVEQWIKEPAARRLLIVGAPGTGKTAFAAHFAATGPHVAIAHFCSSEDTRTVRPSTAIRSVAAGLASLLPDYGQALANTVDPARLSIRVDLRVAAAQHVAAVVINHLYAPRAADELDILLLAPLSIMPVPPGPVVLIIDALDEALTHAEDENLVTILATARGLPSWVRLICTTRPDDRVRQRLLDSDVLDLESETQLASEDLARYASTRLAKITAEFPDRSHQAGKLVGQLTHGIVNFLYAKLVLDDFATHPEDYSEHRLDSTESRIPATLEGLFLRFLNRLPRSQWETLHQRLLGVLCVACEPLQESTLARLTGLTQGTVRRATVALSQFLQRKRNQGAPETLSLFHPSFARFLCDPAASALFFCDPAEEHRRIVAEVIGWAPSLEDSVRSDEYLLSHVVTHLVGAHALVQLESLLSSYCWLYEKASRLGVSDVIADYDLADVPGARQVASTLRRSHHVLAADLGQLGGQLLARLQKSAAPLVANLVEGVVGPPGRPWLQPLNTLDTPRQLRQTMKLGASRATASGLGLSANGSLGALSIASKLVLADLNVGNDIRTFHECTSTITSVCVSETGEIFAAAEKQAVRIWNTKGPLGRLDWTVIHNGQIVTADDLLFAYCEAPDKSGSPYSLRCYDLRSGCEVKPPPFVGQPNGFRDAQLAARGDFVFASCQRGAVVWRARSPSEHFFVNEPDLDSGGNVDVTADGCWLAYADRDHRILVWDVKANRERQAFRVERTLGDKSFQQVAFCNSGRTLGSLSYDFEEVLAPPWLHVWDVDSGGLRVETTAHADQAVEIAGATTADRLITTTISGEVNIWDIGRMASAGDSSTQRKRITQIGGAFPRVFSGDAGGGLSIWSAAQARELCHWQAHSRALSSLDFLAQEDLLVTSGLDGHIRVWNPVSRELLEEIQWQGCTPEKVLWIDKDTLLCFGDDGRIGRWSRRRKKWSVDHPKTGYGGVVTGICSDAARAHVAFIAAPGRKMWVGTADALLYSVEFWGVNERAVLGGKTFRGREYSPVPGVSRDGTRIYAAQGSHIEMLAAADGAVLGTYHHDDDVTYISVAPSGRLLASATNGGLVRVWNESALTAVAEFGLEIVVTSMAFIDNSTLCVGCETGTILLLRLVE
jgi:WD40 repeat protein